MSEHRGEALQTLMAEGVTLESESLESSLDGDFLVYYVRSESQEKAEAVAARSVEAIDRYHQQFKKETWVSATRLELLVDLVRAGHSFNEATAESHSHVISLVSDTK